MFPHTRIRCAYLAVAVLLPGLLLTACHPEAPGASTSPSPAINDGSPSASPSAQEQQLPADGLVGLVGTVTADNGAHLTLTLVVHSSKAATDPSAAPLAQAIIEECSGELDAGVLASAAYGLIQIDYTATLVGSTPWPVDLPLMLLPSTDGQVDLASGGDVTQIAVLPAPFQQGDYVPHCRQSAFLTGAGSGVTYFALPGDATDTPPFERWADFAYGFTVNSPAGFAGATPFGGINPDRIHFAECVATVAPLAATLGYPSNSWSQEFTSDHCSVGGGTQSLG